LKVAILGCGPSGLIAAHAAASLGHEVAIFSRKIRSKTFGAMYLHEPIPGVSPTEPELEVNIVKMGTRENYALKVYGSRDASVSWDRFQDGPSPAWDLADAYAKLWTLYNHRIININLTGKVIDRIGEVYSRVFSTIPTNRVICVNWDHRFEATRICIIHGRIPSDDLDVMYYNGLPIDALGLGSWYRYSNLRGYQSWEYGEKTMRPYEATTLPEGLRADWGIKPLITDCNCRPWIHRLGRFGKWDRHAFTHHAYREVRDALLGV
jgi:hypothetical protein